MGEPSGLRRPGWKLYVVGLLAPITAMVVTSVLFALQHEQTRNFDTILRVLLIDGMLVAAACITVGFNANKPHRWPRNAAGFGLTAFILCFLPMDDVDPPSDRMAVPLIAVGITWVVGWVLAAKAKGKAMDGLDTSDIIDEFVGVTFSARGYQQVRLDVDIARVAVFQTLPGLNHTYRYRSSYCPFHDITAVRTEYLPSGAAGLHTLPGGGGVTLKLSQGPSLRLHTPAGEWIFPTNRAQQACEIIEHRIKAARAFPTDFQPGPIEGL